MSVERLLGNTVQATLNPKWISSIKVNSSDCDVLEKISKGGVFHIYRKDSTAKTIDSMVEKEKENEK